jgi:hypothetical protein
MADDTETLDPESLAADKAAHRGDPGLDVLRWLHRTHHGVLGTISTERRVQGFPTGSIVPFALDDRGRPFVFIANIALHTKNLRRDDRASLFVHDGQAVGDPQGSWRASVNGHFVKLTTAAEAGEGCERISEQEYQQLMARYCERIPQAPGYAKTHGFDFWRMNRIESIRYIAGFGRICSFKGLDYLTHAEPTQFEAMRAGALEHMNEDHENNMKEICHAFHQVEAETVQMVSLERTGCLLQTLNPEGYYYHSFTKVIDEPQEFKSEIIGLLQRARKLSRSTP